MKISAFSCAALAAVTFAVPAEAVVFASFAPSSTNRNVRFLTDPTSASLFSIVAPADTSAVATPVFFSFAFGPLTTPIPALLTLSVTVPTPLASGSSFDIGNLSGSFSFIAVDPVTINMQTGPTCLAAPSA